MRDNPVKIRGLAAELEYMDRKITKQDVKRWTAYTVLTGATLASAYYLANYTTRPHLQNELNVLQGASSYLRGYEGNDPTKALIYTKFSLDATKNNPNMEGISGLEEEVAKIENDIRTSTNKLVFKPVLDYIANRMDDTAMHNKRYDKDLIIGYLSAFVSGVLGYAFYRHGLFKKEKK